MPSGSSGTVAITVRNTGDIAWTEQEKYGVVAEPVPPIDGLLAATPVALGPDEYVLPGESHTFDSAITAEVPPGDYPLSFQMSCPAGRFGQIASATLRVYDDSQGGGGHPVPAAVDDGDGGCDCHVAHAGPSGALPWLGLLALLSRPRRRPRPACTARHS